MQQATNIARQMVTRWGMSDKLGPVTLASSEAQLSGDAGPEPSLHGWRPYSEETARLIDTEICCMLDQAYGQAVQLLRDHRQALNELASALLDHETLEQEDVIRVTGLRQTERLPVAVGSPPENNQYANEGAVP